MHSKLIPIILTIVVANACGQTALSNAGARNEALAAIAATATDEWALWRNPSGLASLTSMIVSSGVRQVRHIPALTKSALIVVPTRLAVGGGIARFGDDLYNEQVLSAGGAHQVGITSIGIRADLFQLRIDGFDLKRTFGVSVGVLTTISPRLKIGACARNINLPSWTTAQPLPVVINAGLIFIPAAAFTLHAEVEKNTEHPPTIKGAFAYTLRNKFFIRTGYNLFPSAAFAGTGLRAWKLDFDYAMQFGGLIGYSHVLCVAIRPLKK